MVIANSNTTTPLIDGDFSAATLKVNGSFEVTGSMTMSVADLIDEQSGANVTFNTKSTIVPIKVTGGSLLQLQLILIN